MSGGKQYKNEPKRLLSQFQPPPRARMDHDELMIPLRFQVDAFLVRDLDSRINSREAAAVAEFIDNSRNKASAA